MSAYWDWLTGGKTTSVGIALEVALIFSRPSEFWLRIQKSVEDSGKDEQVAVQAILEIKSWLGRNPWLKAIGNCTPSELPDQWKDKHDEFFKLAKKYTEVVLDQLPKAIDHYRKAKRDADEKPAQTAGDTQMREVAKAFIEKDSRWRFFGDPAIHSRQVVNFPVAAVFDQGSPEARGCVVRMTVEIIEPGMNNVVPHPLLELSGLEVESTKQQEGDASTNSGGDAEPKQQGESGNPKSAPQERKPTFDDSIRNALTAAKAVTGSTIEVTAGFFSPQFLDHKVSLSGTSAGGAFALGFARVLAKKKYDQRVIVITTVDEKGNLGPVENHGAGPNKQEPTFLEHKAHGIVKHNQNLEWDAPTRIETVAVVKVQKGAMEEALARVGVGKEEIRVEAIEDIKKDK